MVNRNQRRAAERAARKNSKNSFIAFGGNTGPKAMERLRNGDSIKEVLYDNTEPGHVLIQFNSHCKPMCVKEPFRECTACQNPCPHQSNYHRYFVHRFGVAKDNAKKKGFYNSVVNSTTGKYLTDADVLMIQMKHFEKDWLERKAIERGFTGSMEELCGILLKEELNNKNIS